MKPASYYKPRKAVYQPDKDPFYDYRKDEIDPSVWVQLMKARERGGTPGKHFIDNVIGIQNESVVRAIKYIGYKYLGEYSYQEVFSPESIRQERERKHYEESRDLSNQVYELQEQLREMQKLMINVATSINRQEKERNGLKRIG